VSHPVQSDERPREWHVQQNRGACRPRPANRMRTHYSMSRFSIATWLMLGLEICNGADDAREMVAVVLVATTWSVSSHCCCKSACTRCVFSGHYIRRGAHRSRGANITSKCDISNRLQVASLHQTSDEILLGPMRCLSCQVHRVGAYDVGGNITTETNQCPALSTVTDGHQH